MKISLRHMFITLHLEQLSEAAVFVEQAADKRLREVSPPVFTVDSESAVPEELDEETKDELRKVAAIYPQTLRRSLFVTSLAMFEDDLNTVCGDFIRRHQFTLTPHDLRDKGIEKYQKFLKHVCGLPFPDTGSEWQMIKRLGKLRNIFVHRGGRVLDDKDVRALIESNEFLALHREQVVLKNGFVQDVVAIMTRFWDQFYSGLET